MTNIERILFESEYFNYENLSYAEGDRYLDILRHIKEVTDSEVIVTNRNSVFELVCMNLKKDESGIVSFSGAISNGIENKWLNGFIKNIGNKTYVSTKVTRLHPLISIESKEKEFETYDKFKFKDDSIERITTYSNVSGYFESILPPLDKNDFYNFQLKMITRGNN